MPMLAVKRSSEAKSRSRKDGLFNGGSISLRAMGGFVLISGGQKHSKLFTAVPCNLLTFDSHGFQSVANQMQRVIALHMAKVFVVPLKVVNVQHQQRERCFLFNELVHVRMNIAVIMNTRDFVTNGEFTEMVRHFEVVPVEVCDEYDESGEQNRARKACLADD